MQKKNIKYITTWGLTIVNSESLAPTVPVCWRRGKARERGLGVCGGGGGTCNRQGKTTRADGEQIARWNLSSSAAGNGSRCHTHLGEAFTSGGRFIIYLQKCLKTCFRFVIWGIVCRLLRNCFYLIHFRIRL
jgi:hypothetical protein